MHPSIAFVTPIRGGVWMGAFGASAGQKFLRARVGLLTSTDQEDKEQRGC